MDLKLDKEYWENRYAQQQTGWDIGYASNPIVEFIQTLNNKNARILIPGAGNAYEAEYLFKNGFKQVFVLDLAEAPLKNLAKRCPEFPEQNLLLGDFFEHDGKYDFIIEQTFFCAIHPELRNEYAIKMNRLLNNQGKLFGLLFNDPLNSQHPPFGGNEEEYRRLFTNHFKRFSIQPANNSIQPRLGRELFFVAEKG